MDNEFDNDGNYTLYEQDDSDSSEQDEMHFEIKLSKYPRPLELILTFDNYKSEFKGFIHKYQLTRDQSLALKQIVRARIAQQLQKQQLKNKSRIRAQQSQNQASNIGHVQKAQQFKGNKTLNDKTRNYAESGKEKTTNDQAETYSNEQASKLSNKFSKFSPLSKKLFETQIDTELKLHKFHSFNSPISSIHSKSNSQSQGSIDQKNPKICQKRKEIHQKEQKQGYNHHKYIQPHVNEQHHVSFNDLYLQNQAIDIDNNDQVEEEFQDIPKGISNGNIQKDISKTKQHQSSQLHNDYFVLNPLKEKETKKLSQNKKFSQTTKKANLFTPQKKKPQTPQINSYVQGDSNQRSVKKAKVKQIPQSTKVQPTKYNKGSSITKNSPIKSQQKSISKTAGKSSKSITQKQKEVIREIFYRLHRQETASSVGRQKPQTKEKSPQQKQDQKVVYESMVAHRRKYMTMGEEERQELFTKLYLSSTESSMNRKTHLKSSNNYSNQIQHIINESNRKYQQNNPNPLNKKLKQPDLTSPVYSFTQKRCNAHCQKHQYEKRLMQQGQMKRKREQEIKEKVRSRSKQQVSPGRSLSKSPNKTKIFGECQCCHKQKIEDQRKVKQSLRKKQHKRSYNSKTKYSLQKRFLPTNISFISDVLQQSYNQLFPSNNSK